MLREKRSERRHVFRQDGEPVGQNRSREPRDRRRAATSVTTPSASLHGRRRRAGAARASRALAAAPFPELRSGLSAACAARPAAFVCRRSVDPLLPPGACRVPAGRVAAAPPLPPPLHRRCHRARRPLRPALWLGLERLHRHAQTTTLIALDDLTFTRSPFSPRPRYARYVRGATRRCATMLRCQA